MLRHLLMPFDHFSLIARWYDRLIRPVEDGRLAALLAAEPGQMVLDVGGGTGRYARLLDESGVRVIVCDASPGMTRQAQAKGLSAVLCDVTRLPFADGSADRVLVVDAFHHFVAPSPELAQPAAALELVRAAGARRAHGRRRTGCDASQRQADCVDGATAVDGQPLSHAAAARRAVPGCGRTTGRCGSRWSKCTVDRQRSRVRDYEEV